MAKKIHHMVAKKADEIKKMIGEKKSYDVILKEKFQSNIEKKNDWLDKCKELFTNDELAFLEYNLKIDFSSEEKTLKEEVIKQEVPVESEKKEDEIITENITKKDKEIDEELNDLREELSAIKKALNPCVLELLKQIYKDIEKDEREDQEGFFIPSKYDTKKAVTKSFRVDEEIYSRFSDFCQKNNLMMKSCMNYILDTFLSKHTED